MGIDLFEDEGERRHLMDVMGSFRWVISCLLAGCGVVHPLQFSRVSDTGLCE